LQQNYENVAVTRTAERAVAVADAARRVSRSTVAATRSSQGLPSLPESHVAVLHTLRSTVDLTPAELAQRLGLARPTVSNLLRELESAGFVAREPSTTDRRSVTLTITEQARQIQDAFQRGRSAVLSSAWSELDQDDQDALIAATPALDRLADLLHGSVHSTR
jgi:DNA-binding MarR family transcriptional regulator